MSTQTDSIFWDGTLSGAMRVFRWVTPHGGRVAFSSSGPLGAHDTHQLRVATPQGEATFNPGDTITRTDAGFTAGEPDLFTQLHQGEE